MKMSCDGAGKRLRGISVFAGLMLTALLCAASAQAQTQSAEPKSTEPKPVQGIDRIFYLNNATRMMDLNDIQTELRNMLPRARIYGVQSQNGIAIQGSAEDLERAQKMISELDRVRKVYRLTYTITETDGGKRVGTARFSLMVSPDGKVSVLKQGSRVPIVTGSAEADNPAKNIQVQYQDVGLSIEAILDGDSLHSKVTQSSLSEDKSGMSVQDPIVRQTVVEGRSHLVAGKSVVLGALDIPGGMRHEEIEVAAELVP